MTAASFFRDITAFSVQIALVVVAIAVLVRLVLAGRKAAASR